MKIQRQHLSLCLGLAIGASVVCGTLSAVAQTGNQSDVSGAIITTGDIFSGNFAPDTSSAASGDSGSGGTESASAFASPSIQTAINQVAATINTQLAQQTAPGIPAEIQPPLAIVLSGIGDIPAAVSQIQTALVAGGANPTQVQALVKSLQGLTADGQVSPAKLAEAVKAYNAFVDSSNSGFLSNPPPTFLAAQATLSQMVNAGVSAK